MEEEVFRLSFHHSYSYFCSILFFVLLCGVGGAIYIIYVSCFTIMAFSSSRRVQQLILLLLLLLLGETQAAWVKSTTRTNLVFQLQAASAPQAKKLSSALASSSLSSAPPETLWDRQEQEQPKQQQEEELVLIHSNKKTKDQDKDNSSYLDASFVQQTVNAVFSDNSSNSPVYLFDGICNFCDATVHFCYDLDTTEQLRFAPLQSPTGRALLQHFGRHPDDTSSLVLCIDEQTAHFGSDAVLETARRLEGLPALVRGVARHLTRLPSHPRNAVYQWISKRRHHLLGTADGPQCRVDLDYSRFLDQVVLEAEDSYEYV